MTNFKMLDDRYHIDYLGFIPAMLSEHDDRSMTEQLHAGYSHGGGWSPFKGFTAVDDTSFAIQYPGDPVMQPIASARIRDETFIMYPHAWVAVWQPDRTFEISRMD